MELFYYKQHRSKNGVSKTTVHIPTITWLLIALILGIIFVPWEEIWTFMT